MTKETKQDLALDWQTYPQAQAAAGTHQALRLLVTTWESRTSAAELLGPSLKKFLCPFTLATPSPRRMDENAFLTLR